MSLYHYHLKKEINHYQESISRNNKSIKIFKEELYTGENVFSKKAHKNMILNLVLQNLRLKEKLDRIKRLIH